MPLSFKRQPGSAVDCQSGVTITAPRILPARPPEDPNHSEYQYLFHLNGQRVDGLGLFGTEEMIDTQSGPERVFTLDLSRDRVLKSILGFKRTLNSHDSDFYFLRSLAQGLVLANMDHRSPRYSVRHVAVASTEALVRNGISMPEPATLSNEMRIVLADEFNPTRTDSPLEGGCG